MIRLLLDFMAASASVSVILGSYLRWRLKRKRISHQEYVSQLKQENKELDEEIQELKRTDS